MNTTLRFAKKFVQLSAGQYEVQTELQQLVTVGTSQWEWQTVPTEWNSDVDEEAYKRAKTLEYQNEYR